MSIKCLPPKVISDIANKCAEKHNLPRVTSREITQIFGTASSSKVTRYYGPQPFYGTIVRENEIGCIWVDQYYIAYEIFATGEFHYAYLTSSHINEERYSYREAAKERHDKSIKIPSYIEKEFSSAENDGSLWDILQRGVIVRKEYEVQKSYDKQNKSRILKTLGTPHQIHMKTNKEATVA